ncbi:glutamate receptor 1-like [Tachypleus tridentatus]|uniref:glutamate receptor 1-like n=1 Tax=Tachypleus tridentatus TaxID=6853 RepID=UPI003FD08C43
MIHFVYSFTTFIVALCPARVAEASTEKVPLGAIFTPGTSRLEAAFVYAVIQHNNASSKPRFKVHPVVERVDNDDPFEISRKFCQELNDGIFTFIAPTTEPVYDTLASYTNTFQMPFVSPFP